MILRLVFRVMLAVALAAGCAMSQESNAMGATARRLDTSRYFDDPKLAALADDVQEGRVSKVVEALRGGVDPNGVGRDGFRPIFFIFPAPTNETAKALLAAGADANVKTAGGEPPLMYAVRLEDPAFTRVLLAGRADPNARGSNDKPVIHEAVRSDQPEHLRLLARAGVDLNVVWGNATPLLAAVESMSWASATALLELGAGTDWRSPGGRTQFTAGESFCNFFTRQRPLRIPPAHREAVRGLFAAFARRGVVLDCAGLADRL